jgi:hypothetical protein
MRTEAAARRGYGCFLSGRMIVNETDLEYFRRRARQEDECVRLARSRAARDRHLELAMAYRLKCSANSNDVGKTGDQDVNYMPLIRG